MTDSRGAWPAPKAPGPARDFRAPGSSLPPTVLSARAMLVAFRRRWRLALGFGLPCALLAAAVTWLALPSSSYTAKSMLQVAATAPKVLFKTAENQVDFATFQRSQVTLIKSRRVINAALRDERVTGLKALEKKSDPVAWLEKEIKVDFTGEILNISLSGDNPAALAALVNAVTQAYLDEVVGVEDRKRREHHEFLKKIYNEYQTRLEQRRNVLKSLADRLGTNDKQGVNLKQEFALEQLAQAERELMQYRSDLRKAQAELGVRLARATHPKAPTGVVPDALVDREVDADPVVRSLREKIALLEAKLGRNSRLVRNSSDPSVLNYRRELQAARGSLEARLAQIRPLISERLADGGPGPDDSAEALRDRIEVLKQLEKSASTVVQDHSVASKEISRVSLNLDAIQDEILHADNAAKRLGEELETLNVELRSPPRVVPLEMADVPRKEADHRKRFAGGAGLVALALIALGVSFVELRALRVSSADDVSGTLGLPVVGGLPMLPLKARGSWIASRTSDDRWHSLLIESIDSVRTMLLNTPSGRALRAVMVTSAVGGEGKTTLACHLACSLARAGLNTLLVDCDLRNPTVHRMFGLNLAPGFSELVRGEASPHEVLQNAADGGPWVISAGAADSWAVQALAGKRTEELFEQFRQTFDFVVVDATPVLPVADALIVGRYVDAVVCSVLRDVSRMPKVYAANERLATLGIRVLGAVVTGAYSERYDSSYHHRLNSPPAAPATGAASTESPG